MNCSKRILMGLVCCVLSSGCSGSKSTDQSCSLSSAAIHGWVNGFSLPNLIGTNVIPLSVNGNTCLGGSEMYANEPCMSVTLCPPGVSAIDGTCVVVKGLLIDTGSVGLRVFSSVLNGLNSNLIHTLTPIYRNSQQVLTECVTYGDGSVDWGPVAQATLFFTNTAGSALKVQTQIQLIDSNYGNAALCSGDLAQSPTESDFNGILGIGLAAQDCGVACTSTDSAVNPQLYSSCHVPSGSASPLSSASTCTHDLFSVDLLAQQVQNPFFHLSQDSNGFIFELPSIPASGATAVPGYLVLGINTQSNNEPPASVAVFSADPQDGNFALASFNCTTYPSFIDSGSNFMYFPSGVSTSSSLTDCGPYDSRATGFFCPFRNQMTNVALSLDFRSSSSLVQIPFNIGNLLGMSGANHVFNNIGANTSLFGQAYFDLGLPFYLGRNVYHCFEGRDCTLGTGPFWAF